MRLAPFLAIALVLAACRQSETAQQADARIEAESRTARAELEPISANLWRLISAGVVDSAAAQLTADYRWQGPNAPAGSGHADWIALVKGMVSTGTLNQTGTIESVLANGPIAIQTGRFVSTFTPGPGAPAGAKAAADTGKYVWVWRKNGGAWRLALASWNSNLPAKP